MSLQNEWPYVEGRGGNESARHIRLKGLAVYWLLQQGFKLDHIEEEHTVFKQYNRSRGHHGLTDIYAEKDDREVYIECETNWNSHNDLSLGGSQPAKNGKEVYVFKNDGIHRVRYVTEEIQYRGESRQRKTIRLEHVSDLPALDLRSWL